MHVLYKITYLPHIGTSYPKYYVGSKYSWKPGYMGSVSSNKVFEYTDGMSLKDWWKSQTKHYPERFLFEILRTFDDITPTNLVGEECALHNNLGVLSEDYFNQSIATTGFCSVVKTDTTKKLLSEKTKQYWNSPEGKQKKERLRQRNFSSSSNTMKKRWQTPTVSMLTRKVSGRKVGSKNKQPYSRPQRQVAVGELTFPTAKMAAEYFCITPTVVRLYCRTNKNDNGNVWRYI